jgi:hypothetical protein
VEPDQRDIVDEVFTYEKRRAPPPPCDRVGKKKSADRGNTAAGGWITRALLHGRDVFARPRGGIARRDASCIWWASDATGHACRDVSRFPAPGRGLDAAGVWAGW